MSRKLISRAVIEVIDPIRADFWVTIWLGHHLAGVIGQNLSFNVSTDCLSGFKMKSK